MKLPVVIGDVGDAPKEDYSSWLQPPPLAFRFAQWWAKHGYRGKSAIPRRIGRLLCRGMTAVIHTRSGARLAVDPLNLEALCTIVRHGGTWEEHVLDRCMGSLRQGGVFYDIGANAGYFSIETAVALGDAVTVHAFEPLPSLARAIRVSAALNAQNHIHVHEIALSDRAGEATIYVPSHAIHASLVAREKRATPLRCRADTVDNLVSIGRLPPPSVIKIDVEGAELRVFQGARETIRRYMPVIIFECDENALRFGNSPRKLCGFLRELGGYEFSFLADYDDYENVPQPPRPVALSDEMPLGDYIALPPG